MLPPGPETALRQPEGSGGGCAGPGPPHDTAYSSALHALIPQRLSPPSSVSQMSYARAATHAVVYTSGRSRLAGHLHAGRDASPAASASRRPPSAGDVVPASVRPRQQKAPPGFSGGWLQSWALVAACFEHGAPPRTHLPPADEQVLPEDDDEVHAAAVIAIRRRVEGRRTRSKLPRRRRRSTFLRAVPSRNLRPARHPIKLPSHHPRSSGSRHQSTVSSDPPRAAGIPA